MNNSYALKELGGYAPGPDNIFLKNRSVLVAEMILNGSPKLVPLEIRTNPLTPYRAILSEERAKRPQSKIERPEKYLIDKKKDCVFEKEHVMTKTPEPRRFYKELEIDNYIPVSVPNISPFALEHKVNCFTSHEKMDLTKIISQDMYNYLYISKENSRELLEKKHQKTFNFINFGPLAAGTQQHPHSQDGSAYGVSRSCVTDNEFDIFVAKDLSRILSDPFSNYINEVKEKTPLIGYESEFGYIMAPFAPKFPDQVDVMIKIKKQSGYVNNFLKLDQPLMSGIADLLAKSLNFLSVNRGVTDFNLDAHQAALDSSNEMKMPLHFHIYPRNKNLIGSFEIGGSPVIDIFPEDTAKALREYIAENK